MKKILIFACMASLMFSSCGDRTPANKTIRVPEMELANHEPHKSLQRFISDPENEGASVVVRDPNINRDGVSTNPINTRVCALIERGLLDKKFNPRDRRLFENAVAKLEDGSDYPAIRKVTGTDLIFEITQFSAIEFPVNEYYNSNNPNRPYPFEIRKDKKTVITPTYSLIGFSIEIKVILLSDNLIAGIFKYNKIPCLYGCEVSLFDENNLRYINPDTKKTVIAKEEASQGGISFDKYDKEIADFISNVVIPTMFAEMKGEKPTTGESMSEINVIRNKIEKPEAKESTDLAITTYGKKEAKEEYRKNLKEANEILKQRLKGADREEQKEAMKEYSKKVKEEQEILRQRLKGKSREEIQEEEANQALEIENQYREMALSSPNSFDMASSVSDLIFQTITKESKKSDQYKTDEERFSNLKDKEQIMSYISSITTNVASFPDENNETAVFYCKRAEGSDVALLLFLDGKCIGMGTKNKGLLTKIPKSAGIHAVSLRDKDKELLNIPVDYTFKTYYPFEWNRNTVNLTTASTEKVNSANTSVASSSNSYDIANSVSDLILQAITKESKKHEQYKTDEERFSQLKDRKQILDYIASVTNSVGSPQEIENNVVFYCEGAKGNDLALLLFLDGRCIGIGTKNKGLLTQMPKISGIRALSLWNNDKEILNIPVNFSFKTYYPFEWERNVIKLKN
ncbi:MAG: trichohyalin-plectin-homology domain domain-containing protein [Prevotellaceae bacterium]|jgi:hypothetical protein|nr:trichohyalin-plectin-homology domain domain-containing protein [Prevotellaceae bacterium]